MSIEYVVLSVTGYCNLQCKFCFRVDEQINMTKETFYSLYDKLNELGVKEINFTGGEPLCNPELLDILKQSKSWGFTNILSTNGLLLDTSVDGLLRYIDIVALSLDGDNPTSNDLYRSKGHFESTINVLRSITQNFPSMKVKINTLISSRNKSNIVGILDILREFESQIICWKLFQVSSRGNYNEVTEEDQISRPEFDNICHGIMASNDTRIKINTLYCDEDPKYCIIKSDGTIQYVLGDNYYNISSISDLPFDSNSYKSTSLGL